jgi:hypothetical protein
MRKSIELTESSEAEAVPVRRRNTQANTIPVTISLPKELNQTINGIVVKTNKSRSLVIAELLEKGLSHE